MPSWVSWDTLTMPKYMGGLGFRYFNFFNLALASLEDTREPRFIECEDLEGRVLPSRVYSGH